MSYHPQCLICLILSSFQNVALFKFKEIMCICIPYYVDGLQWKQWRHQLLGKDGAQPGLCILSAKKSFDCDRSGKLSAVVFRYFNFFLVVIDEFLMVKHFQKIRHIFRHQMADGLQICATQAQATGSGHTAQRWKRSRQPLTKPVDLLPSWHPRPRLRFVW